MVDFATNFTIHAAKIGFQAGVEFTMTVIWIE